MTQTPKYLQYLDCADASISFFIVVLKMWRLETQFVFSSVYPGGWRKLVLALWYVRLDA